MLNASRYSIHIPRLAYSVQLDIFLQWPIIHFGNDPLFSSAIRSKSPRVSHEAITIQPRIIINVCLLSPASRQTLTSVDHVLCA